MFSQVCSLFRLFLKGSILSFPGLRKQLKSQESLQDLPSVYKS